MLHVSENKAYKPKPKPGKKVINTPPRPRITPSRLKPSKPKK